MCPRNHKSWHDLAFPWVLHRSSILHPLKRQFDSLYGAGERLNSSAPTGNSFNPSKATARKGKMTPSPRGSASGSILRISCLDVEAILSYLAVCGKHATSHFGVSPDGKAAIQRIQAAQAKKLSTSFHRPLGYHFSAHSAWSEVAAQRINRPQS